MAGIKVCDERERSDFSNFLRAEINRRCEKTDRSFEIDFLNPAEGPDKATSNPVSLWHVDLKMLIVTSKKDKAIRAVQKACNKIFIEVTFSKTLRLGKIVLGEPDCGGHHVVLVDVRRADLAEVISFGSWFHQTKMSKSSILLALTSKSPIDTEEVVVRLLDAGYLRCLMETSSVPVCVSELHQVIVSFLMPLLNQGVEKVLKKALALVGKKHEPKLSATSLESKSVEDEMIQSVLDKVTGVGESCSGEEAALIQRACDFLENEKLLLQISEETYQLLETCLDWGFDIFKLEEITENNPLVHLGMEIFRHFEAFDVLSIDEVTLRRWFVAMEASYWRSNPYHNSTHAADVMQATAYFLKRITAQDLSFLSQEDQVFALIAAVAHDLDHPGVTSAFLSNANDEKATLYNQTSVLESHHASQLFFITLEDEKINIFKNLKRKTYNELRGKIIDMILATEMLKHFDHVEQCMALFGKPKAYQKLYETNEEFRDKCDEVLPHLIIKMADISNLTRPFHLSAEWASRICEECSNQLESEKTQGLPLTMGCFDVESLNVPNSQNFFLEKFVQPLATPFQNAVYMPEVQMNLDVNTKRWILLEEMGLVWLSDIRGVAAARPFSVGDVERGISKQEIERYMRKTPRSSVSHDFRAKNSCYCPFLG